MYTILVVLGVIAFSTLVIFNFSVFGVTIKNCVRLDGTISRKRTFKEFKHLARYFSAIAMIVILLLVVVYLALLAVHTYVIPLDIVAGALSVFDFDPVSWEHAIKHGSLGNLDQQYEDWSVRQGYSLQTPEFLADFFFQNWLVFLALLMIVVALIAVLQTRVLMGLTRYYIANTLRRRRAYYHTDRRRAEQATEEEDDALTEQTDLSVEEQVSSIEEEDLSSEAQDSPIEQTEVSIEAQDSPTEQAKVLIESQGPSAEERESSA